MVKHDNEQSLSDMYITMSYTWGAPTPTQTILVDGYEMEVTTNLYALLMELRRSDWVRRGVQVWIDAICINQGDNDEKEHQVGMMRKIYEMAWQVVVWLGPASEHTPTAFGAISWLAKEMRTESRLADFWERNKLFWGNVTPWSVKSYPVFPWRKEVFLALRGFFAQNYWHRLWILQELAMARLDAPVLWGAHCLTLGDIYTAARLIESRETEMGQHISSPGNAFSENGLGLLKDRRLHDRAGCPERQWKLLMRIAAMRRTDDDNSNGEINDKGPQQQLELGALVATLFLSRGAGASEPRDKVYGILGLPTIASTVALSSLSPNYSIELSEVYVNFTRAILSQGDLNSLRFVHSPVGDVLLKWKTAGTRVMMWAPILHAKPEPVTPACPHKLPSWVVCCLCTPPLSALLPGEFHADRGLGDCDREPPAQQPATASSLSNSKLVWRCEAVFVDEIATLSAFNFSEADRSYPYNRATKPTPLPNAYGDLEGLREALWRTLVANRDSEGRMPAPADWDCLLDARFWEEYCAYWPHGPGIQFGFGDFMRRNGDLVLGGGHSLRRLIPRPKKRSMPLWHATPRVPAAFQWASNVLAWRRLIGTQRGRVGLCVPAAQAGDAIAVLKGCGMPMVLRRGEDDGSWKVIGECYLHGVMDGEVADDLKRGALQLEEISLV
ncbi:hypothetical protein PG989_003031 [Apiospora arundinis]